MDWHIQWIGSLRTCNGYVHPFFSQGKGVQSFYVDRQGGIWLGAVSGLRYYPIGQPDQQDPEIYQYDSYDPDGRLSTNLATAIFEDHQGIFGWAARVTGLTGWIVRQASSLASRTTLMTRIVSAMIMSFPSWKIALDRYGLGPMMA